ncbi:hypothetical protein AB0C14_04565 [Microbispora hainanensis]|uniref:hypothetical protein n=1 Tax=Microbispora hainanensis TaxID=568844 RepID=UPI0033E94DEB
MRCPIDSKDALGLELEDPGFHHSVLSGFRDRLARATAPTGCWASLCHAPDGDGNYDFSLLTGSPGACFLGAAQISGPGRLRALPA